MLAVSTKPGHAAWNSILGASLSKVVVTVNFKAFREIKMFARTVTLG